MVTKVVIGKEHDKKAIPYLDIKDDSVIIDDRAYYDFKAFYDFCGRNVSFVTRVKGNADYSYFVILGFIVKNSHLF